MSKSNNLIDISERVGKIIHPHFAVLKIQDLMLYGSLSRKCPNPTDIDLLVIHRNPIFDDFQVHLRDNSLTAQSKYEILSRMLTQTGVDLIDLLKNTRAEELIPQNLFHTVYMNAIYFEDERYREEWRRINCWGGPLFDSNMLRDGLLWNNSTGHFDIPVSKRYAIPKAA